MIDKIEDVKDWIKLTKIAELVKKEEAEENEKKTLILVLCILGAITLAAGLVYAVWRVRSRFDKDYDLYDDLDSYYDEADHMELNDSDFEE